jgi:hypothetical protein
VKIVENTPERLVLRHRRVIRPWVTGAFILLFLVMAWFSYFDVPGIGYGLLLIAALLTLGLMVFDLARSEAVFSRRTGTVTIRHSIPGRSRFETVKLGSIRRAFAGVAGSNPMQSGTVMSGGQKTPMLDLRQGKPVPLSAIGNFAASQEAAVKAVNGWLGVKPG